MNMLIETKHWDYDNSSVNENEMTGMLDSTCKGRAHSHATPHTSPTAVEHLENDSCQCKCYFATLLLNTVCLSSKHL